MVIDSSAIIAILTNEPESEQFIQAIIGDSTRLLSAANFLETAIVIESRYGDVGGQKLDEFIKEASILIEAVTYEQAQIAREAFSRFGKGRHPASLNYGDCFSYALAKLLEQPLLFKGDDFSKTDVVSAKISS